MKMLSSNTQFRMMSLLCRVQDPFNKRSELLREFGIIEGMHVVDYGCGHGACILMASQLAGKAGLVTAVDIHPLAIQAVNEKAFRRGLTNVMGLLVRNNRTSLDDHVAHVVYALEVFTTVGDPLAMLREIRRILDPDGYLFIETSPQAAAWTQERILASGQFTIERATHRYFACRPMEIQPDTAPPE